MSETRDDVLDLHREGLTQVEIAKKLGKAQSTVSVHLNRERAKAQRAHGTPPGYMLRGVSRLEDAYGNVKLQWIKTQNDQKSVEELLNAAMEGMRDQLPRIKPVKLVTRSHQPDLANVFILTDYHLGMLAWGEETGADWDLKIAEEMLVTWFESALKQAPKAAVGIFAQLGDFLHFDGIEAVTPTAHNILDSDTRFQKLVRVAIRVIRRVIEMMLKKYPNVTVLMCEGNHDIASSVWLREWLFDAYRDEPRVTVDQSPRPYYAYKHGDTGLFFHHGHKRNLKDLAEVFASMFREIYGTSKFAYGHAGHLHHSKVLESGLMVIEQHRTLAANDAYGARKGFTSGREASVITYHKKYGMTGRVTITPEMLA